MLRAFRGPVCLVCRCTALPKPRQIPPWLPHVQQLHQPLQQRFLASAQRPPRRAPSRMVLSMTVGRPAVSAEHSSGNSSGRRKRVDGPFAGMNRRVANLLEKPIRVPAHTRAAVRGVSKHSSRNTDAGRVTRGRDRDRYSGPRPFKTLRMHRALATIGYGQRTRIKERMEAVESFDVLPLLPSIQKALAEDALRGMTDIKPTPVQRLAIRALLGQDTSSGRRKESRPESGSGRREFLLAAETGSGKTLAYLLPVLDAMKRAEEADATVTAYKERLATERKRRGQQVSDTMMMTAATRKVKNGKGASSVFEPHPNTARPRVVVLVPSAELVAQVGRVAKTLSHTVKFRTEMLSAHVSAKAMERGLFSSAGVDVVVATPHLLAAVAETDPNVLSRVTHLVVDEADSLMDRSFAPETLAVLERAAPSLQQLILCSATIPRRLDTFLADHFPRMVRIVTPNLHAIPRRVQLGVIDVSKDPYHNNKNLACADAIWSIGRDAARHEDSVRYDDGDGGSSRGTNTDVKRILVFVNERDKAQEVAAFLRSKGIDAAALHRDAGELRHVAADTLALFTAPGPLPSLSAKNLTLATTTSETTTTSGGRVLPNTKVLVATDLASRGIDTLGVRHVVLYDVPHTTIDFIHRLGRAGRMGRRGRGIVLVGKDDRRDVVAEVRESMYMGQALV